MARPVLDESLIHPAIRQKVASNRQELVREVQAAIAAHAVVVVGMAINPMPKKARKLLDAAGVPCGPLHNIQQALDYPQTRARNMAIHAAYPDGTPLLAAGNPVKISGHDDPVTRPGATALDADRAAILKELGL